MKLQQVAIIGNKNTTVENIQQKLSDLGYTSQKVTGYYGDITFNNVAYFQIVNNLTVTGWVDSATYDALIKKSANISEGYFECNDETFSKFDITALEFPGSEYINVVVDMLGGKELLNEIGQQIWIVSLFPRILIMRHIISCPNMQQEQKMHAKFLKDVVLILMTQLMGYYSAYFAFLYYDEMKEGSVYKIYGKLVVKVTRRYF